MEELVIGRYRVIRKLGVGGMAEVYEARHDLMNSRAALKILLPELSAREGSVRRFFREAQATARIEHPGIVRVYDMGRTPDGRVYLVMELLAGEPLSRRLKREKRLSLEATITLIRQLAGVVGAAHQHGIIHRDLKPENLFLVPDPEVPNGERVKVLDFGAAKLLENPLPAGELTVQGTVIGTPAYMAPEQCKSAATVDHRADLYAIGCIFYTCLCGRTLFGTGGIEVLMAHVGLPPTPPRRFDPTIPPAIEDIILRLLRKNPARRFPSCEALIAELDRVAAETPAPRPSTGTDRHDSDAFTTLMKRQNPAAAPEEASPSLAGETLDLEPEPLTILEEDAETLLRRARERITGTMPPVRRARSSVHEAPAEPQAESVPEPLPENGQVDEYLHFSVSMETLPSVATAEPELQALPAPTHSLLDAEQAPAMAMPHGRSAACSVPPTVSDGEIERVVSRTERRSLLWPLAAIGCVGGLVAAALPTIAHYERVLQSSARQEGARDELPSRPMSAAAGSAAGAVLPVVAEPVMAAKAPAIELARRPEAGESQAVFEYVDAATRAAAGGRAGRAASDPSARHIVMVSSTAADTMGMPSGRAAVERTPPPCARKSRRSSTSVAHDRGRATCVTPRPGSSSHSVRKRRAKKISRIARGAALDRMVPARDVSSKSRAPARCRVAPAVHAGEARPAQCSPSNRDSSPTTLVASMKTRSPIAAPRTSISMPKCALPSTTISDGSPVMRATTWYGVSPSPVLVARS